jgi:hypothetical protein
MSLVSLDDIHRRLDEEFLPNSQRHNEAMVALSGLSAGLDGLAKHGVRLGLVDDPQSEPQQYPMALYHDTHGMIAVASEEEAADARARGFGTHPALGAPAREVLEIGKPI